MAKIQKTITIEVCDRCGKEGWNRGECCICHKELCNNCDQFLTVSVERSKPGGFTLYVVDMHHEGLRATFCIDHAQEAERVLREAGFKDFSYNVQPM